MKKTILLICFVLTLTTFAQKEKHKRIKAFKIAFITEKLDLTTSEAEKFWPIYNGFSKREKQLKKTELQEIRKKIKLAGGIDTFSDKEAVKILNQLTSIQDGLHQLRQNLITDLKFAISTKKILKLLHAEKEFHRNLLNRLKNRKRD